MTTATNNGAKKRGLPDLTPGGWVRAILYGIGVLLGLAATLSEPFGFPEYKMVLAETSALLIVLTGGTAILNLGKAEDQQIRVREIIPHVRGIWDAVTDMQENEPRRVAEEVERRLPAPSPDPSPAPSPGREEESPADDPGANLPVFRGPVTRE